MSKRVNKKLRPVTESRRFEAFVKGRDQGLERILAKYLDRIDSVVDKLKEQAEAVAAHMATRSLGKEHAKRSREEFQKRLEPWFEMGIHQVAGLLKSFRRTAYVLTYAGQAEALGRALDKPTRCHLSSDEIRLVSERETHSGGDVFPRIELALHRLLRDVVDAYQLSQVMESDVKETLDRIQRAFPPRRLIPKRMAPMKEAAKDRPKPPEGDEPIVQGVEIDNGFSHLVTSDEWNDAVQDYLDEYVPNGRGPYDSVFTFDDKPDDEDFFRYRWEVEQEFTNDFVDSVRAGEVDAANENGITDFVWIAVLDSRTDTCCTVRDGLLTAEIEAKLKTGEIDGDECDATVPPAHMNCRCRVAPATEDLPAKTPPDFGSWDDWLSQKARG